MSFTTKSSTVRKYVFENWGMPAAVCLLLRINKILQKSFKTYDFYKQTLIAQAWESSENASEKIFSGKTQHKN